MRPTRPSGKLTGTNTLMPFDEGWGNPSEEPYPADLIDAAYGDEVEESTKLEDLAVILREIIFWLVEGNRNNKGYRLTVFRKTMALAWVMRPEAFGGKSLRAIAKEKGVGVNFKMLSIYSTRFSDMFGIRHGGMKPMSSRKPTEEPTED